MNYRLALDEYGPQPYSDWDPDSLFDADLHMACRSEDSIGQFLCARRLYVIERIPEPEMIYEGDFYHA